MKATNDNAGDVAANTKAESDLRAAKAPIIKRIRGPLMLFIAALVWGAAFVAQSVGMDYVDPVTFNGVRCFIGAIALGLVVVPLDRMKVSSPPKNPAERKLLLRNGTICGVIMFVASTTQQIGLKYTTAGKAGFITALYIVIVPILGMLFGRRVKWLTWVAVASAVSGFYLLCGGGEGGINVGDLWVAACALSYSTHIIAIDRFVKDCDGVRMSLIQFIVCGLISLPVMFIFEKPSLAALSGCVVPLLYAGIMSCGVAYTFQILAQRETEPVVASLIMSLESVFAALTGWLILSETLLPIELAGCILIFIGVILAQVKLKSRGINIKAQGGAKSRGKE